MMKQANDDLAQLVGGAPKSTFDEFIQIEENGESEEDDEEYEEEEVEEVEEQQQGDDKKVIQMVCSSI